jgi:hypothetical protein
MGGGGGDALCLQPLTANVFKSFLIFRLKAYLILKNFLLTFFYFMDNKYICCLKATIFKHYRPL